jgi:transcriptional regulator with XRE-family HTH domain
MDQPDITSALGDEIVYWRRRRGLSRDELGAMVGASPNTVGRWERGDTTPDVPQTWAIARALRVDLVTFIERVETAARLGAEERNRRSDLRERAYGRAAVEALHNLHDIRLQGAISEVLMRRCRAVPLHERRATWRALTEFLPDLDSAAASGLVTPEDVRTVADSLEGPEGIFVADFVQAMRRMVDRRVGDSSIDAQGPNPPEHVLAANDPGEPSQYERVTREQDDAYDIDQSRGGLEFLDYWPPEDDQS